MVIAATIQFAGMVALLIRLSSCRGQVLLHQIKVIGPESLERSRFVRGQISSRASVTATPPNKQQNNTFAATLSTLSKA
jgi:hypothetical protein